MTEAFWDASAIVPLCVQQEASFAVSRLLLHYSIVVWWGTGVEIRSAVERLLRTRELTRAGYAGAGESLNLLRSGWREIQPNEELRSEAERLLSEYPLKAADSLQLAAAWVWADGLPEGRTFVSGDSQLLEAARRVGFRVEAV